MLPKWSDWNLRYTKQGLMKQNAKKALTVCALVAVVVGIYKLRKDGEGVGDLPSLVRHMVKSSLLTIDRWLRLMVSKV